MKNFQFILLVNFVLLIIPLVLLIIYYTKLKRKSLLITCFVLEIISILSSLLFITNFFDTVFLIIIFFLLVSLILIIIGTFKAKPRKFYVSSICTTICISVLMPFLFGGNIGYAPNESSSNSNVSMTESQIKRAINEGLAEEPYTSGDYTSTFVKCDVTGSGDELPADYAETIRQQLLNEYASQHGETSAEFGKPLKKTYDQTECDALRIRSAYPEYLLDDITNEKYYQKPDGNYVIELTIENSMVFEEVRETIRIKFVTIFDERSYIVHEEVTRNDAFTTNYGNGYSISVETLIIDDIVYQ